MLSTLRLLGGFGLVVTVLHWAGLYGLLWALAVLAPLLGIMTYQLTIFTNDYSPRPFPAILTITGSLA